LAASRSRILVSVTGHDETMAAAVHAGSDYEAGDLVFGGHFVDILRMTPEGDRVVDLTRFHEIEPASDSRSE
jgi:inward rectifier potassium channel